MKHVPLESMWESLEDHEARDYGVCPECGRRIVLPCLACQVEVFRQWYRASHPASQDDLMEDLSICLESPDEQRRYEEVRDFREKYHFPMWSAKWYEWFAKRTGFAPDVLEREA